MKPQTEVRHTPLPWNVDRCEVSGDEGLVADCGVYRGLEDSVTKTNMANAAFIVFACNAFDSLERLFALTCEAKIDWDANPDLAVARRDAYLALGYGKTEVRL